MRRGGRLLAAGLLALGVLTACGPGIAPGVDRDLVDDWPVFAAAVTATPTAGQCYVPAYTGTWSGGYDDGRTVECTRTHSTEASYVGTFTDALAERSVPPLPNSADLAPAYQDCLKRTQDYLGGPWQTGYVWLGVTLPSQPGWKGGARWYRCDVLQLARTIDEDPVVATTSVKDGLRGARPLARTCSVVQDDGGTTIKSDDAVACNQPHNAEFAGLFTLTGGSYPSDSAYQTQAGKACGKVVAAYLGTSSSQYFGWAYAGFSEEEWNLGLRTGTCEVLAFANGSPNKVRFTGSVKGIGTRKPTNWKS